MPTAKRNRKVKRARGVTKGLTPEQKKLRQTLLLPVNRIRRDPTKPPPPPKGLTAKVLLRYAKRISLKNATAVRIYVTYTARVKDKPGLFRFVAAKLPRDLRTGIIQPKTFWVRSLQPMLPLSRAKLQVSCTCVTADTWISTQDGLRQVKDLVGPKPYIPALANPSLLYNTPHGLLPGTRFWQSGVKPVFEVTTSQGFTLKATADHRVLVCTGYKNFFRETPEGKKLYEGFARTTAWKMVKDLKKDDKLVISENTGVLPKPSGPKYDLGWALGFFAGDGSFFKPRKDGSHRPDLKLYAHKQDTLKHFRPWLRPPYTSDATGRANSIKVCFNAAFEQALRKYGISRGTKTLTEPVLRDTHILAGFIAGIFDADGTIHKTGVRLHSTDRAMLQNVMLGLNHLGVRRMSIVQTRAAISMYVHENDKPTQTKPLYMLNVGAEGIAQFQRVIQLRNPRHVASLERWHGPDRHYKKIRLALAFVTSVQPAGTEPVYDCTIKDAYHAYSANGLVSHNCEDDLYSYDYARDRHGACVRPKHNGEPPDVRNPNMWPGVCCHGVAILEWILETDAAKPLYFEKRPYLKATDVSHL